MFGLKEDERKALEKKDGREEKSFFFFVGEKLRDKKEKCREYISIGPTIFFPAKLGRNEKVERIFYGAHLIFPFLFSSL